MRTGQPKPYDKRSKNGDNERGGPTVSPHQQGALQLCELTKSVCKPTGAYSRDPSTKLTNYTTTIINISDIKVEKYKKCGLVCSISLGGVTRSRRAQRWCTMTATGARRRYINSASPHDVLTSPNDVTASLPW